MYRIFKFTIAGQSIEKHLYFHTCCFRAMSYLMQQFLSLSAISIVLCTYLIFCLVLYILLILLCTASRYNVEFILAVCCTIYLLFYAFHSWNEFAKNVIIRYPTHYEQIYNVNLMLHIFKWSKLMSISLIRWVIFVTDYLHRNVSLFSVQLQQFSAVSIILLIYSHIRRIY